MPPTAPVILHLTDLHFGWDARDPNAQNLRNTSQQTLLNTIDGLPAGWKPTVVCLSGDIGWHGAQTDYEAAAAWLNELLSRCGLGYDRVLVAAGNHDIMREEASYVARPGTPEDADRALRVPIGPPYKAAFAHFTQFCERTNIPAMQLHGADSWLAGERMLDGVRFVSVNSSWFCRDDHDLGKLWVGLPQLRDLEARHQLGRIVDPATPLTVTLVHHPPDWWHEAETHTHGNRPNTRDFLADRSHLLLTGHTHARATRPDRLVNAAYHFPGAAAYAGGGHPNGFRLIRLAEQFDYRSYEYDSGEDRPTWRWVEGEEVSVARQDAGRPAPELGAEQKKKSRP